MKFSSVIVGLLSLGGAFAALSSGCGKATSITSGVKTITHNGKQRQYTVAMPNNYNQNNGYRLIFGPHWLNGNMGTVVSSQYYGLQPLSNNSAIFVAPNGINAGWGNSGGEDVTFFDTILSTISSGACVETSLVFSTGWSYGGAMSYALACARGSVYRAVGVMSGAQLSGCSGGSTPVAYYGAHGTHDSVLNISQGRSIRDTFVRANGCASQNPPEPGQNSGTHIKTQYSGCQSGKPVTWIAFDGDHVWDPRDRNAGSTWQSGELWSFFSQFTATGGGTTTTTTTTSTSTSSGTTSSTTTTTTTSSGCTVPKWGQCGGQTYTGCTTCESGSTCTYSNPWYSQCL